MANSVDPDETLHSIASDLAKCTLLMGLCVTSTVYAGWCRPAVLIYVGSQQTEAADGK